MLERVHVLLIDENPEDRAAISAEFWRELPNLCVTEITDQRGLDGAIATGRVDLVITDYQLSWSNGLEVLRAIKRRYPDCPVIMFTSAGSEEIAVEAMKAGLDDYLIKSPNHLARLCAAVSSALEKSRKRSAHSQADVRYRGLFDNVPVGLFVVAADGQVIEANPALAEILGYDSRDDLVGMNVTAFDIGTEDAARFLEQLQQTGEIFDLEVQLGRSDGSVAWLLINARAARDEHGKTLQYQGAVEDITEHVRAEQAVRESEQRFDAFMNNSPVIAFIKDEEGRYQYASEKMLRFLKKTPEEVYGKTDRDLVPHEIARALREQDRKVLESGNFSEAVQIVPGADGVLRSWMVAKFPITDPQERNFVGGFALDITERQRAEEAERRNEKRFRDLFENSPDAIFVEDLSGHVLDVNRAACELHGVSREALIGKNCVELVPEERRAELQRTLPSLASGELTRMESASLAKDGRVVPVAISASRIEYQGQPALLLHVRDISEQRRLQEQFLQAQKMEAIGRLAGGVAHDFNNLLTAILGYNDMILNALHESDPLRRSSEEVKRAAERAGKLTKQLLAFSRKQPLQPRVLDLNLTVAEIKRMLQRLIGDDIELTLIRSPGRACVKADPGQIEQVIINLAVNARDAMPTGGKLTIRVKNLSVSQRDNIAVPKGDYVLLSITDTGTGMTREVQSRIFEPFFTTKEEGKGTGLGLATCYGIVKQSGGRILCKSERGAGTTFFVYLPRVKDESPEIAATESLPAPMPRGTEKILVVEDSPGIRDLTTTVLRSLGYEVTEAENGEHALRIIEELGPGCIDLVVTDVMMPQMGGKELVERFREKQPDAKVLFNSGSIEHDAKLNESVQKAGTGFLHKPFTPADLARKVREVLDMPASTR